MYNEYNEQNYITLRHFKWKILFFVKLYIIVILKIIYDMQLIGIFL